MKLKKEIIKKYIEITNKRFPNGNYSEGYKEGYLNALYWVAEIETEMVIKK